MAGRAGLKRVEDVALITGRGRFCDDLPQRIDTLHAAILRSPHPHAEIRAIDAGAALALPGIACVITGEDALRWTRSFTVAVKAAVEHRAIATDRVRYVGEPVAVAVARDRHTAEDALEAIAVDYRALPAIVDPEQALEADAPVLHAAQGGNLVSDRKFRYGDPEAAFAAAPHRRSRPLSAQFRNAYRGVCRDRRIPTR